MTYIKDLTSCGYFRRPLTKKLLAVGWLEPHHEFSLGRVEQGAFRALIELLRDPWQPGGGFRGLHDCGFCNEPEVPLRMQFDDIVVQLGAKNVFVPGSERVYVAPSLVLHYIKDHGYCPPEEFCDAVIACPPMRSDEYFKAVAALGPTWLREFAIADCRV